MNIERIISLRFDYQILTNYWSPNGIYDLIQYFPLGSSPPAAIVRASYTSVGRDFATKILNSFTECMGCDLYTGATFTMESTVLV